MKKATQELYENVLALIGNEDERPGYTPNALVFNDWNFTVDRTGDAWVHGLGSLPFDWTQRRSLRRAFKRRHDAITATLIEAGRKALREQGKES